MPDDPHSKDKTYTQLSVWLLPATPLLEKLRSSIQTLAKDFDAIEFEPHVTIFSGSSDDDEMCALVQQIASMFPPCELAGPRLHFARQYTKTLFLQFDQSAVACGMFDGLKAGSARPSNYVLNPHLSLMYKTMPLARLAEISQTLEFPKGPYLFDRLRVIETEIPLSRPKQISGWRTVFECALRLS
jgi:hypothetical protein